MMRDLDGWGYYPSWWAPPPLHTYNPCAERAAHVPLARPVMFPQHPGPTWIHIPTPAAAELGDDPTDAHRQHHLRAQTTGMFGRLHDETRRKGAAG